MNSLDTRRNEMLVRVRDFGVAHENLFPPPTLGGQSFAAVGKAVAALSDHAATQVSGRGSAREGTVSKAMALDTPGVDDKFRLPRGNGDQTILNAARAFARDAAPLSADFTKHDMPDDFLADLHSDIDAFEEAIRDHETGKDTHVAARAGIETAIDAGLDAVRRLDAIVPNRLQSDSTRLAMWERARRVEYRAGRPRIETTEQPEVAAMGLSD